MSLSPNLSALAVPSDFRVAERLHPTSLHFPPTTAHAMAAISGAADIVTAYARGSGAPRQPAGSSTTLEDALKLFGTDATEGNTSGGAQKKRKLNNGRRLELQPVGVFDEEQSVVLVTIQLDLVSASSK